MAGPGAVPLPTGDDATSAPPPRTAAVLLAAGSSSRLGQPKQLVASHDGEPLVRRAARALLAAGAAPVVVVVGADAQAVIAALAELPVRAVPNARYAEGMGTSIACGVHALRTWPDASGVAAAIVAACDMPGVGSAHYAALIAASAGGTRRVASSYPGEGGALVRGIPALFPSSDWPALAGLSGDTGARGLLRDTQTLTVFLRGGNFDVDTPADLARWQGTSQDAPP